MADPNIGINVDGYQGDPNLAFGAGYGGGVPLQVDMPNTTNYLQQLTENAIKKKQADFAFFEKNVGSALANIKKTDGILPEDAPYINKQKKELFKYIIDNIDAFAPTAVLKSPEKVTEVDNRISEYLSDVDASKQWKKAFVDEGYKQMLRKPDQNNEVNIARYQEMIKTPLKERQPFVPISDGADDFQKAMVAFYKSNPSSKEIKVYSPEGDPGTSITDEIFKFDKNQYLSLHKAHRGEYLSAYWNMHPEIQAQYGGDVNAYIDSQAPAFQESMVANRNSQQRPNVSYVEGQKGDRNNANIAGRKEIAEMNDQTRRYVADQKAEVAAQKLAVKGTYGTAVKTAFESIDNMEITNKLGSVDDLLGAGTGKFTLSEYNPQSIPNKLSTKIYTGGASNPENNGVMGNLYKIEQDTNNDGTPDRVMYAAAMPKYYIGDKEVTADRYKISTSSEKRIESVPNPKKIYTKNQLAKEMMNTEKELQQFTDYENAQKGKSDQYFKQSTPSDKKQVFKYPKITGYVDEFKAMKINTGNVMSGAGGSLHPKGYAVDIPASTNGGVEGLRKLLPELKAKYPELDIVDEIDKENWSPNATGPHIHIEMDSKYADFPAATAPATTAPATATAPKKAKKDWSKYKR